ncbi:hypothetical protein [Secundilactobacillus odoratitofui]|uniref:hypothetical protein n=1 Tax=Secundilactobacillus odoratitofui TaxID=480930 RepID=UPI0006CF374E|nr:hypothetical protein [Secundilactobacillus odoratitofui]
MGKIAKSLVLGVAATGVLLVSSVTAQAKTYAKVKKITYSLKVSSSYVTFTGKNALYTKAGTMKGAKLVKTKAQLLDYANSTRGLDSFMWLRTATTNRNSVYVKVRSFDNQVTGWIYAGKTTDYSLAYARYKDKALTNPAGGIEMYRTLKDDTLTQTEKTSFYQLANPGTATDGTAKIYSIPFDVSPLEFGGVNVNMPNKTDSSAYANDVFVINRATIPTRQGGRWLSVTDLNNNRIAGYIKEDGLKQMAPATAKTGVTINYVDYKTKQVVGSVIVPYHPTSGQDSMNLSTTFYDYQGQPTGYDIIDEGTYVFGLQPGTKTAKPGDVLTDYVIKR